MFLLNISRASPCEISRPRFRRAKEARRLVVRRNWRRRSPRPQAGAGPSRCHLGVLDRESRLLVLLPWSFFARSVLACSLRSLECDFASLAVAPCGALSWTRSDRILILFFRLLDLLHPLPFLVFSPSRSCSLPPCSVPHGNSRAGHPFLLACWRPPPPSGVMQLVESS